MINSSRTGKNVPKLLSQPNNNAHNGEDNWSMKVDCKQQKDVTELKDWQKTILNSRIKREEVSSYILQSKEDLNVAAASKFVGVKPRKQLFQDINITPVLQHIKVWKSEDSLQLQSNMNASNEKLKRYENRRREISLKVPLLEQEKLALDVKITRDGRYDLDVQSISLGSEIEDLLREDDKLEEMMEQEEKNLKLLKRKHHDLDKIYHYSLPPPIPTGP